ncbi:MAG: peptide chain release factor-like protein [Deltaproteobacteria bacterium]|nr:peptide chain release factor-like protein [Deltaproteobacteria bacterium]
MQKIGIREEDLEESFIRGSGRGGQKINKTSSCVRLKHVPSGIEVRCQQSRSREENRFFARRLLCEKYEASVLNVETERQKEIEKIRRQKRKRSKRSKEKILRDKKVMGEKKKLRGRINIDPSG